MINRHKAAIRRKDLSLPVKCVIRDELLATSFFDFGCGHGHDLALLSARGYQCAGFDPAFRPDAPLQAADVVNLGYVINVIEDVSERAATLRRAWELAQRVLVVSAQIQVQGRGKSQVEFGDGVLTRIGTFQKFFRQGELKEYLEEQLAVEVIPAALGVFYVFKDETLQQQFLAGRYRRRPAVPRQSVAEARFAEHRELLAPLIAAVAELGRLPSEDELLAYSRPHRVPSGWREGTVSVAKGDGQTHITRSVMTTVGAREGTTDVADGHGLTSRRSVMATVRSDGEPTEQAGRPHPNPLPEGEGILAEIVQKFGSLKRAFALVRRVTGDEEWQTVRKQRTEDLLVYLALARFRKRPPIGKLPVGLQRDIREFFGTYKRACEQADTLLFEAGRADAIDEACCRSPIGKLLPNALYVHRSALESLEPILRIYEGCGRAYLGEIEDATIIKLHRFSGKISYLAYPDFETDPHPALKRSVKLSLRSRELDCWDYAESDNPPILHRKETFLEPSHSLYARFARLTAQEERHGLLDETATIGTRAGWRQRLVERRFAIKGHRLVRTRSDG